MKRSDVKIGMSVKVSKHSDMVYTVKDVFPSLFSAELEYELDFGSDLRKYSGGIVDVSILIPA